MKPRDTDKMTNQPNGNWIGRRKTRRVREQIGNCRSLGSWEDAGELMSAINDMNQTNQKVVGQPPYLVVSNLRDEIDRHNVAYHFINLITSCTTAHYANELVDEQNRNKNNRKKTE